MKIFRIWSRGTNKLNHSVASSRPWTNFMTFFGTWFIMKLWKTTIFCFFKLFKILLDSYFFPDAGTILASNNSKKKERKMGSKSFFSKVVTVPLSILKTYIVSLTKKIRNSKFVNCIIKVPQPIRIPKIIFSNLKFLIPIFRNLFQPKNWQKFAIQKCLVKIMNFIIRNFQKTKNDLNFLISILEK